MQFTCFMGRSATREKQKKTKRALTKRLAKCFSNTKKQDGSLSDDISQGRIIT